MANDYFQDITPESGTPIRYTPEGPRDTAPSAPPQAPSVGSKVPIRPVASTAPSPAPTVAGGEKSIRNVTMQRSRPRVGGFGGDIRPEPPPAFMPEEPRRSRSRLWIWLLAGVSLLVLGGVVLLALRETTVTVTPRTQPVVFDQSISFSAAPVASAATGTLPYTIQESDFEDSTVVPAQGVEKAEDKATGNITIYNAYSTAPNRLIKNTRFETPEGLVFRIPESVVVPGKSGTTPGQIEVTVFADQPGEAYNVGPVAKFTVPGLKATPDMYAGIYARSTSPMSGGFSGERPAVAPGALENARAEIRMRLEARARETAQAAVSETALVFPTLVKITYQSLPSTTEAGGGLRIHEKAHVVIPVFNPLTFGALVARNVTANDTTSGVRIEQGAGFSAVVSEDAIGSIGLEPFSFSLSGSGTLVWDVDVLALQEALAGRDQTVFQSIVEGFPSIQEAHARIAPFWKNSFPADGADIQVILEEPQKGSSS